MGAGGGRVGALTVAGTGVRVAPGVRVTLDVTDGSTTEVCGAAAGGTVGVAVGVSTRDAQAPRTNSDPTIARPEIVKKSPDLRSRIDLMLFVSPHRFSAGATLSSTEATKGYLLELSTSCRMLLASSESTPAR